MSAPTGPAPTSIRYPRTPTAGHTARQVATAYGSPVDRFDGTGSTIGVVELGGAYIASDLTLLGLDPSRVTVVPVAGGNPKSDGPGGADAEVMLDVEVIAAVAPGAQVRVYFGPNTDAGFLAAIAQACAECGIVSISWGAPESSWAPAVMDRYEQVLSAARARGVRITVAAGDAGSTDGTGRNVTDFPASSPSVIACGGTRLTLDSTGRRLAEVVWNNDPTTSATGGGVSSHFPGRMVPDVAGNADPVTGYRTVVDGQSAVIGGTSAVAPLVAAMLAVTDQAVAGMAYDFLNTVLTNPSVCFDVTSGNNGGYRAGPGRDQVSGYGVVDFGLLLAVLASGAQIPAPGGNPAPVPVPTVTSPPVSVATWARRTVRGLWRSKQDRNAAQDYLGWLDKQQ